MNTTSLSQRDPRWAGERLGTCEFTISQAGCLVTAIASILVDFEIPSDPSRLNRWLRAHGGYVRGCNFVFDSMRGLGANLEALIRCPRTPAPMERIAQAIEAGRGVVAMVDARPDIALQQHWVRLLACERPAEGPQDCRIMDPWQLPGHEETGLLEHYGRPGWDAAKTILGLAIYARNVERVMTFAYGDPRTADAQEEVAIRPGSIRLEWRTREASLHTA